jgi:hypothetical protein
LIEMKTLKIIIAISLAVVAAAILIATAFAYTGGLAANSVPQGAPYGGYYGGMMGSGGMMRGYGYYPCQAGRALQQPGYPSTTTPTAPPGQYPIGGWGCIGMRSRLP